VFAAARFLVMLLDNAQPQATPLIFFNPRLSGLHVVSTEHDAVQGISPKESEEPVPCPSAALDGAPPVFLSIVSQLSPISNSIFRHPGPVVPFFNSAGHVTLCFPENFQSTLPLFFFLIQLYGGHHRTFLKTASLQWFNPSFPSHDVKPLSLRPRDPSTT